MKSKAFSIEEMHGREKQPLYLKESSRKVWNIESWNKILGRDIRKLCKFCVNRIGMFADISCGDLWNLDENHNSTFSEDTGQNIVFARSSVGHKLLKRA